MNLVYSALVALILAVMVLVVKEYYIPMTKDPEEVCHTFDVLTRSEDGYTVYFGKTEVCFSEMRWSPIWRGSKKEPPKIEDLGSLQ